MLYTYDGLQYLRARYYDTVTETFIQEDTYRGEKTDPLSQNRYIYGRNNPYKYSDPSGHISIYNGGSGKAVKPTPKPLPKPIPVPNPAPKPPVVSIAKSVTSAVSRVVTQAKQTVAQPPVKTAISNVVKSEASSAISYINSSVKSATASVQQIKQETVKMSSTISGAITKAVTGAVGKLKNVSTNFTQSVNKVADKYKDFNIVGSLSNKVKGLCDSKKTVNTQTNVTPRYWDPLYGISTEGMATSNVARSYQIDPVLKTKAEEVFKEQRKKLGNDLSLMGLGVVNISSGIIKLGVGVVFIAKSLPGYVFNNPVTRVAAAIGVVSGLGQVAVGNSEIGEGAQNIWYRLTGQTDKRGVNFLRDEALGRNTTIYNNIDVISSIMGLAGATTVQVQVQNYQNKVIANQITDDRGVNKGTSEDGTTNNDISNSPRTGSALKVDKVKPIYKTDSLTGKRVLVQEFPAGPQAHGFNDIIDNYAG